MDKIEIEKYRKQLAIIQNQMTDDFAKKLTKEEIQEYIVLVSQIEARIKILEKIS